MTERGYRTPTADDDADVPYWLGALAEDVSGDVADIDKRSPQVQHNEQIAFSVVDRSGRRFWLEAGYNGRPTPHALRVLAEDLGGELVPEVGARYGLGTLPDFYGWAFTVTDESGRVLGGWRQDGTFEAPRIKYPGSSVGLEALAPEVRQAVGSAGTMPAVLPVSDSLILATVPRASGGWEIRRENPVTGETTVLHTASGPIRDLSLSEDRATVFFTVAEADGSDARALSAAVSGGPARRVIPFRGLAAFGDSMTEGMGGGYGLFAWPAVCAAKLGIPFYNGGVSSQMSTEIAIRQGGVVPEFSIDGGRIPATGTVSLTITDPLTQYRSTYDWKWSGTLAGVPGVLRKNVGDLWSFTRDAAGAAVNVSTGRFVSTPGRQHRDWVQVLWTGRNNPVRSVVLRDTAAMVAGIDTVQKRFLVLSICNTASEARGSSGYNNVLAINAELASIYGSRYLDVRSWLIANGLQSAGITATAQDAADAANDVIPTSLRADSIHLNAAGYAALGRYIADVLTERGWV